MYLCKSYVEASAAALTINEETMVKIVGAEEENAKIGGENGNPDHTALVTGVGGE